MGASSCPDYAFSWIVTTAKAESVEVLADSWYPRLETKPKDYNFAALDAKLSAALTRIISGEFEKKVHIMKINAMASGNRLAGRQILYLIDQHFKLNEQDGAVFGLEHLFAVTMRGNQLEEFLYDWELVLAGVDKKPDDTTLEVLFYDNAVSAAS